MQININFTETPCDEKTRALVQAYWGMEPNGEWTFKMKELASRFELSTVKIHSKVASICNVTSIELACSRCHSLRPSSTRSSFTELIKDYEFAKIRPHSNIAICAECKDEGRLLQLAQKELHRRVEEKKIKDWLADSTLKLRPKYYTDSSMLEAFLIHGLLRYTGDEWRGEQLDAWVQYRPRLCVRDEDIADVYKHLYRNGWIVPDVNSPLDAFSVDGDDNIAFDVLRVNWLIAADADEIPHDQLVKITGSLLAGARSDDLLELWQWVCIRELRSHFEHCNKKAPHIFYIKGWTEKIEQQLLNVLDDRSLAQAKSIVYTSIRNLRLLVLEGTHIKPHVQNMLPGSFMLMSEKYQSSGWKINTLSRVTLTKEAIYTSHLFDHVLGGGTDFYLHMTGNRLRMPSES